MFPLQCLLCEHVNPAGAKFCNDCGAPLKEKPCGRCEAVNDQAAKNCYKCGAEFPAPSTASEVPPTSSAPNVTAASPALGDPLPFRLDFHLRGLPNLPPFAEMVTAAAPVSISSEPAVATNSPASHLARPVVAIELDKLDRAFDPQHSTFDSFTPSVVLGSDRGHPPEPESAADIQSVPPGRLANEMVGARESERELVTREPRSSRVALAVALPTVAVIAIGGLAYYVYMHSVPPLGETKGAQVVSGAPADVNAGGPPASPIPIGVTASSAPSAAVGTGSAAATGGAIPAPSVEPSTAVTSSPVNQGAAAATGSNRAASQIPSPSEPHRQVSTSDRVSPSEELAAKADDVAKKPGAATANAGNSRDRTMPAAGSEVTAKASTPNRPMHTYSAATASGSVQPPLRDTRATARPDVPRPGPCTEGVAALGLCRLNSEGENK